MGRTWKHSTESRHARGYGTAWDKLRKVVLVRDGGLCRCAECKRLGRIKPAAQVDHIVPKSKGGTDDLENLQAIALDCHQRKTTEDEGKTHRQQIGADGWPID